MSNYGSQTLVVGPQPVGFDPNIINPSSEIKPCTAFGIVEGQDIRVSSCIIPTNTSGILAGVGSSITITGEYDIEHFKAISTDISKSGSIYFEFGAN
jgi:hypothetical protein